MKRMELIFLKILLTGLMLTYSNSQVVTKETNIKTDIQDIILVLREGLVLNSESPANTYIGDILVLTYSRTKAKAVAVESDNKYVYLKNEKLYLKDSGNVILKNLNHILFEITAVDTNNATFSKYIRIPVDHRKEDAILKVTSIDDLCNTDSNRLLFIVDIADPSYDASKPYNCRIGLTNYPNIEFIQLKVNSTRYEVFLPEFNASSRQRTFFDDMTSKPLLLIDYVCTSNFVITHERTIDFKICKRVVPIENIVLDDGLTDDKIWIQFDWEPDTFVAKLKPIDYWNRVGDQYMFYLAESNNYLDVTNSGIIRLKRKLDISLLKYYNPKLRVKVGVADLNEPGRDIKRVFRFNINDVGQPKPPLRFRADFQIIPIFQFAQSAEFLIKLGQFELNTTTYPLDRYDIRLAAGNVTLDDQGNLFIGQDPLKDVNAENQSALIALNIYDKKANVTVFEEVFDIEIPDLPTTIGPSSTTFSTPRIPDVLECFTDVECNQQTGGVGANKCIRMSSMRELNQKGTNDTETTLRLLQFLNNKDPSLFLKYNEILLMLQAQDRDLQDVLDRYGITQRDLANVGACICDQDWQGWRCATPLPNPTPFRCHPNSSVPACTPQNGVCRPSEFLLRNSIKMPPERLLDYRSYYCECTSTGIVGVNCDFQRNPCSLSRTSSRLLSGVRRKRRQQEEEEDQTTYELLRQQQQGQLADPVSRYATNNLGSVDANQGQCSADPNKEFCQPQQTPNDFVCLRQPQADLVNYLTFDESFRNPNFAGPSDNYKKLNVSDATVAMGIQSFIRDEVIPRYSFNDYSKIPKGPLAIMRPSINMPDILNQVRNKINTLIDRRAEDILDQLQGARVQDLIQDTLLYLIANKQLNSTVVTPDNLTATIFQIIDKLNLSDLKNFSTPLWSLAQSSMPANLTSDDPSGLIRHLNALQSNSDKLTSADQLGDVLGLKADNLIYLDFFNFSTRPYSLLKLDILPGIFVDSDNELSLRPVPGVFLESIPNDPTSPDRELIFLPGIFNPAASKTCDLNSIFTPGIMSLPIDNYDLANLPLDNSRYLNRFIPMQLPFNINGFLTPLRSSTSDTIASLLLQQGQGNDQTRFNSHLLLTPIDFSADATYDIITKNDKFMSNLFSDRSFYKVVEEQKPLDVPSLASTQILSDPTMVPANKKDYLNSACINRTAFVPKYDATRGTQFYAPTYPTENVTVLPFTVNDAAGNPIPQAVVKAAIEKYCQVYIDQMNDFHARICTAQNLTNKILDAQKNNSLCPGCPFNKLAYEYYNPSNKKRNSLPLLILASILAALWLAWMLSMLACCCCRCCPLYGLFCRKRRYPQRPTYVITNKSSKIFAIEGTPSKYTMIANGELVRSAPKFQTPYRIDNSSELLTILRPHELGLPTSVANTVLNHTTVLRNGPPVIVPQPSASGVFIAKRLPPRVRSASISGAPNYPQVTSLFKRSSSYPYLDVPNFYRNNRYVDGNDDVVHRFNKTTLIDENGGGSRVLKTTANPLNEPPKTVDMPNRKNIEFKLKRLSNYIVDQPNPGSSKGPNSTQNFRLNRIGELESPPNYQDATNPVPQQQQQQRQPGETDSNNLVIDWLLRKTDNETTTANDHDSGRQSSNDDQSDGRASNLTVVRVDNSVVGGSGHRPLLMQQQPPNKQRCFVCDQEIDDTAGLESGGGGGANMAIPDEAIYICDRCYASWYSAPAGAAPPPITTTTAQKRRIQPPHDDDDGDADGDDENNASSSTVSSTVYSLTKDNRIRPPREKNE